MRRGRKGELGEYDSLTDTVTNVVGVLVIVLAVTRVSLGNRAPELRDAKAVAPAVRVLEKEKKAVDARLEEVRSELEARRSGSGVLSTWSVPFPDPARVEGKELVAYYCQGSRVHPFRIPELTQVLNERARGVVGVQFLSELEKHERVARYCRDHKVGDEDLRWSVVVTRHEGGRFSARAELSQCGPEVGEDSVDLASNASAFRRSLANLDPRKQWIYFYAWDDSFDVYLEADRIARESGFATGWIPYAGNERYGLVLTRPANTPSDPGEKPFPQ
jgi:hypothetical protein